MKTNELYKALLKMTIPNCEKVAKTIGDLFTMDMESGNHDMMARFLLFYNLGRMDGIRAERVLRRKNQ